MDIKIFMCLIIFTCFIQCSGILVRVSYDASSFSSSPPDLLHHLKQNGASHVRISDANHGLLTAVCSNKIEVDLYMCMKNIEAVSKSRNLAVDWAKRVLSNIVGFTNITIVVSNKLMKENDLPMLLPAIKEIDSALKYLKLSQDIKLSASFSLDSMVDCFRMNGSCSIHELGDTFVQVINFLRRTQSSVTLDAFCGNELRMNECLIRLKNWVSFILLDCDIPVQVNLQNSPSSSPFDGVKLNKQLTSMFGNSTYSRSLMFYVRKQVIKEVVNTGLRNGTEQASTASQRKLIKREVHSTPARQLDVTTPLTTVPALNPATPAADVVNPLASPDTSTTATPLTNPSTSPNVSSPVSSSQSWCIASQSASQTALQVALDYACGYGGADCAAIQQGGKCYIPDSIRDHASYAFNNYYQKNPVPTSCNFGGTAVLTNIDPSTSTCQYQSTSTSSSVLNTTNPIGSTVFGSGPSSSNIAASTSPSLWILFTVACHIMPLTAVNHI